MGVRKVAYVFHVFIALVLVVIISFEAFLLTMKLVNHVEYMDSTDYVKRISAYCVERLASGRFWEDGSAKDTLPEDTPQAEPIQAEADGRETDVQKNVVVFKFTEDEDPQVEEVQSAFWDLLLTD